MVARIVGAALAHRAVVLLAAAALLTAGLFAVYTAPLDVFPELAPPVVEVQTEAPGFAAADVEAMVTTPLERALGGIPGVERVRSSSALALGVVKVFFPYGTDPSRARQLVIERVALAARDLPPGVTPAVSPLASMLSTILVIGLRGGPDVSPLALRDLAEWTLRPRLLAVPGIASVVVYGGAVRQVQLTTTPERLQAAGATLDDLVTAAAAADAPSGSGFVDRSGQRLLAWFDGRIRTRDDLAQAPLPHRDPASLPVSAVADVSDGPAVAVGDALIDGEPGVLLLVAKQPNVNVPAVTRGVEEAMAALRPILPAGVHVDDDLFRQATFTEHALRNLRRALFAGGVLVTIVLLLFLGSVRTAFASLVAIPLSLVAAVAVLRAFGATLNIMTLGGLAIAVGEVVDDAVIDVENAWRRLRAAPRGTPVVELIVAAAVEVRSAVVYATLMVALVFLPVYFLDDLAGVLFRPLATAYVLATLASLLVALTVTPVLASLLLPGALAVWRDPPRGVTALRARYRAALARALGRPRWTFLVAGLAGMAAVLCLPALELEFLPEFHETNFVMHMTGAPGVGLAESSRVGALVAHAILEVPGVTSVAHFIGRASLSEDAEFGTERGELLVRLAPDADSTSITRALAARVAHVTGFAFDVKQFLNERIEETLEGTGAALVVHLRGADLASVERAAGMVAARLARVAGAVDVHASGALTIPGLHIRARRDALLQLGVPAASVERALRSALGGLPAGRIVEGDRRADVVIRLSDDAASDPTRLAHLPIALDGGKTIALGAVASITGEPMRATIGHEDGVRSAAVRLDVRDRSLAAVTADVRRALREIPLPDGVYAEMGGEYLAAERAGRRLAFASVLALVGIFALLLVDFGSARLAALVLVNVPLALVGGVIAVALGGGRLSVGAIVGFVTLFGITIRNGIVLVAHFLRLEHDRGRTLTTAELVDGAADRVTPIVMTALITGIALWPLLLLGNHAGGEIEYPMALVISGGLVTSTWLNLFVVPIWYRRLMRARAEPRLHIAQRALLVLASLAGGARI